MSAAEVLCSLPAPVPLALPFLVVYLATFGEIRPRLPGREEELVAIEKQLAVMKQMLQEQSAALSKAEE